MAETILTRIKANYSKVFRRVFVKRRSATTGLFESSWQELTDDVQTWGTIRKEIDAIRFNKIKLNDIMMKFDNSSGKYNPHDDASSFWSGHASQQRTLVKIESGFYHQTQAAGGIWINTEFPTTSAIFYGVISGDIFLADDNFVQFQIKPLTQVFRDFPAGNLTGFTSTGLTASQFVTLLRDQTDGAGSFIFRPFFGDTTTNWNISATTNIYQTGFDTSTGVHVYKSTVFDVLERLAEAEDMVFYVKTDGTFQFVARDPNTTVSQFHHFGAGFLDSEYGSTIKKITHYGKRHSDYYSRVEVKWINSETYTSLRVKEAAFTVTGNNDPWILGHRTYRFENFWIPTITTADTILNNIYNNVTSVKTQIEFTASFVPHLDILDRIGVSYDSAANDSSSRWDIFDWAAENTSTSTDLFWDKTGGNAIFLNGTEFKILSIELNLDKLETKVKARQV